MRNTRRLLSPAECLLLALRPKIQCRAFYNPTARAQTELRVNGRRTLPNPFADKLARYTRDNQIESTWVRVKQADGSVGEPQSLRIILRFLNRQEETVIQLSKPGAPETIVQIQSLQELRVKFREEDELKKQHDREKKQSKPKQIELNWAISGHDLELKLKQLEQFMNKGKKVEILLAPKKRARRATDEEGDNVLKKIREKLVEIDAKEVKPMDGQLLRTAVMVVKKRDREGNANSGSVKPLKKE